MEINEHIVRDREATVMTGLSRSQRYRLEKAGEFPDRRKLSSHGRATGYLLSELRAWIATRTTSTTSDVERIGKGKPGPGRRGKHNCTDAISGADRNAHRSER